MTLRERPLEDWEYPEPDEDDDGLDDDVIVCRRCKEFLIADVFRCPYCGIEQCDSSGRPIEAGRPWWVVLIIFLTLITLVFTSVICQVPVH